MTPDQQQHLLMKFAEIAVQVGGALAGIAVTAMTAAAPVVIPAGVLWLRGKLRQGKTAAEQSDLDALEESVKPGVSVVVDELQQAAAEGRKVDYAGAIKRGVEASIQSLRAKGRLKGGTNLAGSTGALEASLAAMLRRDLAAHHNVPIPDVKAAVGGNVDAELAEGLVVKPVP